LPAFLPMVIGIAIILLLAYTLWPFLKSRQASKPEIKQEKPLFMEEYAGELSIPAPQQTPEPVPELPGSYGIDRLILMVKDPYWLYAYWEITATSMEEITSRYGPMIWENSKPVLRVYDVTGIIFNGANANRYFDCALGGNADDWHINAAEANRSFCVDLGRLFPDGSFITLLRSNIVTTPRDSLSDRLDEEWMWIEGLYTKFQMGISSPLIIEEISERMGEIPLGISSPGFYDSHVN